MKFQVSVWSIPRKPNESRYMVGFMDANGQIIDCAFMKNFHCVFPTYKNALATCGIFQFKGHAELLIEPIPEIWGGQEEEKARQYIKFAHDNNLFV